ncbi:kinase D-interacting substrate of 220 kDa B isoform X2 [Lingula anatina]|uniref:Kinase D-interacting substrate of 220 kDa B isoform X2 n=1 Tax=Lingula anatina TaxID=7574 RepID=A0A1S3J5G2_LINAN|nr:kinase D-interacting substrate of 220 kDa B isoform X2 [Lingula anatina]|eukprot:XP_013405625.1 kinase D-interacting substrate of 220 kDa B isoform X2 [Lingula anatina]
MAASQLVLGRQLLFEQVEKGDGDAVAHLLLNTGIVVDDRDDNNQTPLMVACQQGHVTIATMLLDSGADVNAVDDDNWSPLLNAAKEGHTEIVKVLLEHEAHISHRDMGGWTALMWACYKGRTEIANILLEHGANPNVKAEHTMTCLIWASGRGHVEIVKLLLSAGAKVNTADKYGTTPLIWACRRGCLEIVEELLLADANVDVAGMNAWTALLVAVKGGFVDIVSALLNHEIVPNVNCVDKDGLTPLSIAAKDGYFQIVKELLQHGAYVNIVDKSGDSVLIRATKSGHLEIVQALLKKHADIDVQGEDNKTALYFAVEKGHVEIARAILEHKPDKELATKDGTTPLLKAVKNRNYEMVNLLLNKGAKVSATNKKGDNALHIALRVRSRRITELLLRNPKESRLLYRTNKVGETPYMIDGNQPKSILTSILGRRNLNQTERDENFDLYSSALADCLSEPTLHTPITVGLFAKWGSGKSILLERLQDELVQFAHRTSDLVVEFSFGLFFLVFIVSSLIGLTFGLPLRRWEIGVGIGVGLFVMQYAFLGIVWVGCKRKQWRWALHISSLLEKKLSFLFLLVKMVFCNPPKNIDPNQMPGIRFMFSDYMKLTSVGAEKSIAMMVASLCEAMEEEYGMLITRLYRVFKPKGHTYGRFKSVCCIPNFLIAALVFTCLIVGVVLVSIHGISAKLHDNLTINAILITIVCIVGVVLIANIVTWWQIITSLLISQHKRTLKTADSFDSLKLEGMLQMLKSEVKLMSKIVNCHDAFMGNKTRLVVIVDGLDSCEQDKVLQVFDTVNNLFSDQDSPFILILAVDPHVIIKGIETNLNLVFHDSNITGNDYLRNMVHLPFYLQSQGILPKASKNLENGSVSEFSSNNDVRFRRQDSSFSQLSVPMHSKTSERRRAYSMSGNVFSSVGSVGGGGAMSRQGSTLDLARPTISGDYFSDINPRSMRRLVNIVAITGRLLRAYNIDFCWYRLSHWVNLTEQWPYRTSWILWYFEQQEKTAPLDDKVTLKDIYDKITPFLPPKELHPLIEIDRNPQKLEVFLASFTPQLTVGDIRRLLPCSISIDPYLRKLIKEFKEQQDNIQTVNMDYSVPFRPLATACSTPQLLSSSDPRATQIGQLRKRNRAATVDPGSQVSPGPYGYPVMPYGYPSPFGPMPAMPYGMPVQYGNITPWQSTSKRTHTKVPQGIKLAALTVEGVCLLLEKIEGLNATALPEYQDRIRGNNITGIVLINCDLDELKLVMGMTFGDWQLFRAAIMAMRDQEMYSSDENEGGAEEQLQTQYRGDVTDTGPTKEHAKLLHQKLQKVKYDLDNNPGSHLTAPLPSILVDQASSVDSLPRSSTELSPRALSPTRDFPSHQGKLESVGEEPNEEEEEEMSKTPSASSRPILAETRQDSVTSNSISPPSGMRKNDSLLQQLVRENQMLRNMMDEITEGDAAETEWIQQDGLLDPILETELPPQRGRSASRGSTDYSMVSFDARRHSDTSDAVLALPPQRMVTFASRDEVHQLSKDNSLEMTSSISKTDGNSSSRWNGSPEVEMGKTEVTVGKSTFFRTLSDDPADSESSSSALACHDNMVITTTTLGEQSVETSKTSQQQPVMDDERVFIETEAVEKRQPKKTYKKKMRAVTIESPLLRQKTFDDSDDDWEPEWDSMDFASRDYTPKKKKPRKLRKGNSSTPVRASSSIEKLTSKITAAVSGHRHHHAQVEEDDSAELAAGQTRKKKLKKIRASQDNRGEYVTVKDGSLSSSCSSTPTTDGPKHLDALQLSDGSDVALSPGLESLGLSQIDVGNGGEGSPTDVASLKIGLASQPIVIENCHGERGSSNTLIDLKQAIGENDCYVQVEDEKEVVDRETNV